MNILILSWRGPKHPNEGGAEQVTWEHAKSWVSAGHTVTLFTSTFANAREKEVKDGITIIRQGGQAFGVKLSAFWWYFFGDHKKFDLVVDEFHGLPFFTPLYVRTKKLAFIHEVSKEVWQMNPWPKPWSYLPSVLGPLGEQWIFRLFYTKVPFMTVSTSTKKDLKAWGIKDKHVAVIHNGFSPIKVFERKKEKSKTLVFLGAISKDKGIEETLRVFSLIHQQKPDWQFWIIGKADSEYLTSLKQLAKETGINHNLVFWGFVKDDKKFELLSRSHLLVNLSYREGWGLVVIEAASVGVPTAAFDVAGLRDSILANKTGILIKKRDAQMLSAAIIQLLEDTATYKLMTKACKVWSKRFNWKSSTKKSLQLIEQIGRSV